MDKCPKCNGNGFVPTDVFGVNGAIKCDFCDGTGVFITNAVEPMTNEEWRKTCSAEEFADFLAGVAHAGAYEVRNCNTNGMLQTQNTDFWLAWLKEKHREEETK